MGDSSAAGADGRGVDDQVRAREELRQPVPRAVGPGHADQVAVEPGHGELHRARRAAGAQQHHAAEAVRPEQPQLVHERRQVRVVADQPVPVADDAVDRVRLRGIGRDVIDQVRDRRLVGRGHVRRRRRPGRAARATAAGSSAGGTSRIA